MTDSIQVQCLINRVWNISTKDWDGDTVSGTLIDISTQSADDNSDKIIPVGIVMLETTGAFHSVPVEFITKI